MDMGQKITCQPRVINHNRVAAAREELFTEKDVFELSQLFRALADSTPLQILHALEAGEMCVCDLAALLPCSESAVSYQLRKLKDIHLIKARRQGQIIFYCLDEEHVSLLFKMGIEHIRKKT